MKIFAARVEGQLVVLSVRTAGKLRLGTAQLYWRPADILTASDVLTIPDILAI